MGGGATAAPSGVYVISVNGTSVPVYCDMSTDGGGWIVFQHRFDGGLDFNRSWVDFAAGFGAPGGEQWIGNDNLWRLTTLLQPVLRIEETRSSGEAKVTEYGVFRVAAAGDMYRLTVGGYRVVQELSPRGDCLTTIHNGMRFSTFDRDNDLSTVLHCAAVYPGGWWFRSCHAMNLNRVNVIVADYRLYMDQCFANNLEFIPVTRMLIRESVPLGGAACVVCPGGTWSAAGATACSNCTAGQWSGAGASACATCGAGAFAAAGSPRCTLCPAGQYAPVPGAPSCALCPAGTSINTTGATSAAACAPCPGGRYSEPGSGSCGSCRDGFHVGGDGSSCVPSAPAIVSAVARNDGGQPGLGDNDTVLVTMNVRVDTGSAVLAPVNVSLGRVSYTWLNATCLLVAVANARGASDAALTRVGALVLGGVLRRADGLLSSVDVSAPVSGSWGPFDAPRVLSAVASNSGAARSEGLSTGDVLTVTFDVPTNTPPADAVLALSAGLGSAVSAAWRSPNELVLTVLDASGHAPVLETRVGTLTVTVIGDLRSRDESSLRSAASTTVAGSWGNSVAFLHTDSGDPKTLSTGGGEVVTLTLVASLGTAGDVVSASYSNGGHVYTATSCAVLSDGSAVACRTVPGVGAGFQWAITLNGVPLPPSNATTSFAPPVISGAVIDGSDNTTAARALPAGGQAVRILGRNYGTVEESAVSDVVFSPRGYDDLVFRPTGCRVTVSHTTVTCTMPPFTGSNFVFSFKIGGQNTTDATLGAVPPLISSVAAAGSLGTGGGTLVRLRGSYFGVVTARASSGGAPLVAVNYGAGLAFKAAGCAVTVAQSEITCTSVPGFGAGLPWRVTLLGVDSNSLASELAYAPPHVSGVTGGPPGTAGGSVVTVVGSNFAGAYPSVVRVLVDGAALPASAVVVLDDRTLSVSIGPGVGRHALAVQCDSLVSPAVPFWYAAPSVAGAGVVGGSDSSRLVAISGANFGGDAALVTATIGNASCTVTVVADTMIRCTTNVIAGDVVVAVAGNASSGVYYFDAAAAQPAPILTGVVNLTALPLLGGGVVALSGGSLLPPPPAVSVVMRLPGSMAPSTAASLSPSALAALLCPAARAFTATGGNACVRATRTTTTVTCTLAPSDVRTVLVVAVNVVGESCKASAVWAVVYDAPLVAWAAPRQLRPRGGDVLQLVGHNFPVASAVTVGGSACVNATRLNESFVACVAPPGRGSRAIVRVNGDALIAVAYAPPAVQAVVPSRGAAGDVLTVRGGNLELDAVVRVGGWIARVASVDASESGELRVFVPVGVGVGWDVDVAVGDRNATIVGAFSYDPPRVNDVAFVDGSVGGIVNVSGRGFGPPGAPVSVAIGAVPCDTVTHASDVQVWCGTPPLLQVGRAEIVVVAGGQSGSATAVVQCPPGFFGGTGDRCAPCPEGASCAGRGADPAPLAGYWGVSRTVFVQCVPKSACVAAAAGGAPGPNCAGAYTGDQCRSCAGGFYRKGTDCTQCPNDATLLVVLFVVLVVGVGAVASWLHRRMVRADARTFGCLCARAANGAPARRA